VTRGWSALGESVTGTGHRLRNVPCQDAFRFRAFGPDGDWLAVAVADGAGSATHAEAGATVACDEFARRVGLVPPESLLTPDGMTELFRGVRDAVLTEAERLGVPGRELACTALLAVIGPTAAAFAQVGDGAIVVGDRVVFWPDPAEYANATDFLTDADFPAKLRFETADAPVPEVAVLTDGLQRLALDFAAKAPHAAFFRPLFDALRSAADSESLIEPFRTLLDSPRVNARTDDDKTLVLAVRR